jgi:very-short-patch-repair endonuclease
MPCAIGACRRSSFAGKRLSAPYIVDFLCVAHRLIAEADGSQHAESGRDTVRDGWLAREGYTILRFSNHNILTARQAVLATIAATCGLPW